MAYYGTLAEANAYFAARLHSDTWTESNPDDRPKALTEATRILDALQYKGVKHAVWLIMYEYDSASEIEVKITDDPPTRDEVIAADATQELEFPRGKDEEVPIELRWATYEIALELLDGFDPEDAIERADVIRQAYSSVRTTYADQSAASEYLVYGIPTARVWRWIKPFLSLDRVIRLSRAD